MSSTDYRAAREAAQELANRTLSELQSADITAGLPLAEERDAEPSPLDADFSAELRRILPRRQYDPLGRIIDGFFSDRTPFVDRRTDLKLRLLDEYAALHGEGPLAFAGQPGAEELYALYGRLRVLSDEVVARRAGSVWLLLTRRLHGAWREQAHIAPRFFAEGIARGSTRASSARQIRTLPWEFRPRLLEDVHDLLMITTAMWNVGNAFRSVAKGAVVTRLLPPDFLSFAVAEASIAKAILLYEVRSLSGAGTRARRQGVMDDFAANMEQVSTPGGVVPVWQEVSSYLLTAGAARLARAPFMPLFHSTDAVFAPIDDPGPPSARSLGGAAVLWACWNEIVGSRRLQRVPSGSSSSLGLVEVDEAILKAGLNRWAPVARRYDAGWDPASAWDALCRGGEAGTWIDPSPPVLLPARPRRYVVDLVGVTRCLYEAHERPAGGDSANQWTRLFERQVQEVIDQTSWRPDAQQRSLIGKVIRSESQAITDIDAVASREGVLLLCDAKAWATSRRHEQGDYDAVRTRQAVAEKAERDWRSKIALFSKEPELLGIDVSGIRAILGVVVSPDVPYVLPGPCTEEVLPHLYAVSTIRELDEALSAT